MPRQFGWPLGERASEPPTCRGSRHASTPRFGSIFPRRARKRGDPADYAFSTFAPFVGGPAQQRALAMKIYEAEILAAPDGASTSEPPARHLPPGAPAQITAPPTWSEYCPIARFSSCPLARRRSPRRRSAGLAEPLSPDRRRSAPQETQSSTYTYQPKRNIFMRSVVGSEPCGLSHEGRALLFPFLKRPPRPREGSKDVRLPTTQEPVSIPPDIPPARSRPPSPPSLAGAVGVAWIKWCAAPGVGCPCDRRQQMEGIPPPRRFLSPTWHSAHQCVEPMTDAQPSCASGAPDRRAVGCHRPPGSAGHISLRNSPAPEESVLVASAQAR